MLVFENVLESEYIGVVMGKLFDFVKCEINDFFVLVNSEIVFEGIMLFIDRGKEGSFGDYLVLIFDGEGGMGLLFKVDVIMYRDDVIFFIFCLGNIVDELVS